MHADAAAVGVPGGRVADHEADALGGLHPERREEEADAGRRGDADGPACQICQKLPCLDSDSLVVFLRTCASLLLKFLQNSRSLVRCQK